MHRGRGLGLAALLSLALVASPAAARRSQSGPDGEHNGPRPGGRANPGEVVASELAFNRLAQDKGQWTAFLDTAAQGARMFAPQPVLAAEFLKKRANPKISVKWQPHEVWSSCDGSYAVTRGAWQNGVESGYFITLWQRQRKGGYKWLLDQGDTLPAPLAEPEMIAARVAECPPPSAEAPPPQGKPPVPPAAAPTDPLGGLSLDGSLGWQAAVSPDGARMFTIRLRQDGAMREVLNVSVAAPPPAVSGG